MKFEDKIKYALNEKAKDISLKDDMLINIKNLIEKENVSMKKFIISPKKVIALCFVLCAIGTVGVIGAGMVTSTESHSSRLDAIRHYPSQEELSSIIDYEPKYVEKLGKYDFDFASPADSKEKDDNGNTVHQYKDITFWYKTDNGILTLSTAPEFTPNDYSCYNYEEFDYNGIKLYYNFIKYKFVPPDYELTEEDKRLKENKELEISYGSQEIEYSDTASVSWSENGIKYCIMDMDVNIPKVELLEMAKQVIGD